MTSLPFITSSSFQPYSLVHSPRFDTFWSHPMTTIHSLSFFNITNNLHTVQLFASLLSKMRKKSHGRKLPWEMRKGWKHLANGKSLNEILLITNVSVSSNSWCSPFNKKFPYLEVSKTNLWEAQKLQQILMEFLLAEPLSVRWQEGVNKWMNLNEEWEMSQSMTQGWEICWWKYYNSIRIHSCSIFSHNISWSSFDASFLFSSPIRSILCSVKDFLMYRQFRLVMQVISWVMDDTKPIIFHSIHLNQNVGKMKVKGVILMNERPQRNGKRIRVM